MTQNTIALSSAPRSSLSYAIGFFRNAVSDLVAAQRLMRERDDLAGLSEAALKDLGLTQADVEAELRKPFWQR